MSGRGGRRALGLHWPRLQGCAPSRCTGQLGFMTMQPGQSWAWRCLGTRAGPPPHLGAGLPPHLGAAGPPPWFRDAPSELHRFQMREGASRLTPSTWLSACPVPPASSRPFCRSPAQLGPRSAGVGWEKLGAADSTLAGNPVGRLADRRGPPAHHRGPRLQPSALRSLCPLLGGLAALQRTHPPGTGRELGRGKTRAR